MRRSRLYRLFYPMMAPLLRSRLVAWGFLGVIVVLTGAAMGLGALRTVPLKMLPFDNKNELLLVLDNCEHLLAACAQLVEDLASCPDLTILTTSREPLGVTGETLYLVSPLALPSAHLPVKEISQVDSVRLFVERAQSILPNFNLTPDNAESVSTICRDLDGIPLAIELASARVNVLGVKQIQERLDRRFDLLVSTKRADERHRTLRTAIDWSYELLSSSERILLQRLALFTAGFTLSTAESACAWGEIQREDVLELLAVDLIGIVPEDEFVLMGGNRGAPVALDSKGMAGQAFRNIARRIKGEEVPFLDFSNQGNLLSRLGRLLRPGNNKP